MLLTYQQCACDQINHGATKLLLAQAMGVTASQWGCLSGFPLLVRGTILAEVLPAEMVPA